MSKLPTFNQSSHRHFPGLETDIFGLVIVGGGPAGIASLLAAHRMGQLDELLDNGVAIIEQSDHLGGGLIGQYAINSDSSGRTFVDCLLADTPSELTRLEQHPLAQQLRAAGEGAVPLHQAGRFLNLVGRAISRMIAQHSASAALTGHRALSAKQVQGGWSVLVQDIATGRRRTLRARSVVIATVAHQPASRLAAEHVGGCNLASRCAGRLLQSGEVLTSGGLERVAGLLAGKAQPKVAIVGGSTSAAAVAHALLHRLPHIAFGPAGITLMHRRKLHIYYPSRADALADGYGEWTEDDVCQLSGRVFRFAGFRLDSRELVMQARGIGGRTPEPCLRLQALQANSDAARAILDTADIVVAAMGYRPHALAVFDHAGQPIALQAHAGPQAAMVDSQCRVLDAQGQAIPALFGIGLAAGFVPRGALGGEISFRGQANGLWLWQHNVGALIINATNKTKPKYDGSFVSRVEMNATAFKKSNRSRMSAFRTSSDDVYGNAFRARRMQGFLVLAAIRFSLRRWRPEMVGEPLDKGRPIAWKAA